MKTKLRQRVLKGKVYEEIGIEYYDKEVAQQEAEKVRAENGKGVFTASFITVYKGNYWINFREVS